MLSTPSKTSLALLLIAVLCACRMSCLAFTWQPVSDAASAHSCCHKAPKDQTQPTDPQSNCKSDVFESAIVLANLALDPVLHEAPDVDLLEAGEQFETSYNSPIHSPPDLLALHHILLI